MRFEKFLLLRHLLLVGLKLLGKFVKFLVVRNLAELQDVGEGLLKEIGVVVFHADFVNVLIRHEQTNDGLRTSGNARFEDVDRLVVFVEVGAVFSDLFKEADETTDVDLRDCLSKRFVLIQVVDIIGEGIEGRRILTDDFRHDGELNLVEIGLQSFRKIIGREFSVDKLKKSLGVFLETEGLDFKADRLTS